MSDPPDLDSLARRYLDLWQQGMSQAAADPDAARALAAFFAPVRAVFPPAGAAPERQGDDGVAGALARIEDRLARIEARLAALETPRSKPRTTKTRTRS